MKIVNLFVWSFHAFSKSALQAPTSKACTTARNYSRCVINVCFTGEFLYMYSIHWLSKKHSYNYGTNYVAYHGLQHNKYSGDFSFCHFYSFLMILFYKTMLHSGPTKAFLTRVGLVTSKSSPTIWTFWPTWNNGQNKLVSCSLVRQCMLMSWWYL